MKLFAAMAAFMVVVTSISHARDAGRIAFASDREGDFDIYIMDAEISFVIV